MTGDNKNLRNLKMRLFAKRRIIRKKLNPLKQGDFMQESMLNPITKHLKNIENKIVPNILNPSTAAAAAAAQIQHLQQKNEIDFHEKLSSSSSSPPEIKIDKYEEEKEKNRKIN